VAFANKIKKATLFTGWQFKKNIQGIFPYYSRIPFFVNTICGNKKPHPLDAQRGFPEPERPQRERDRRSGNQSDGSFVEFSHKLYYNGKKECENSCPL
jgi:hypothetical protein